MKKKITYELPCHRKAEDSEVPPQRRKLRKSLGAFLALMMLFMFAVPEAKADIGKHETATYDKTDNSAGYVEFSIPVGSTEGVDTQLNSSSYMEIGGAQIFNIVSECSSSGDRFQVKMLNAYIGRVQVFNKNTGNWEFISTPNWTIDYYGTDRGYGEDDKRMYARFRYYPSTAESQKYRVYINAKKTGGGYEVWDDKIGAHSLTKPTGIITSTDTYDFSTTVGELTLKTKPSSLPIGVSKIKWNNGTEQKIENGKVYSCDYKIVNYDTQTSIEFDYIWEQSIEKEPLSNVYRTKKITIPAYHWPNSFEAQYDKATGLVKLTWAIDNAIKNCITGDDFEIEASIDENFGIAANVKTIALVKFDINKTEYSIEDNIAELSDNKRMYYRIRRTHTKNQWGWKKLEKTSVGLELTDHAIINSATTTLDIATSTATIKWTDRTGYWSDNTKLIIEKRNVVTGGVVETFELTKAQWEKGEYVDDGLVACISYGYKLQIKPGNTIFPAKKAVVATGQEILITEIGELKSLKTSKGYYPDRVSLQWRTKGKFDQYIVRRTQYAQKSDTVQLALVPASASDIYTFDDDKNVAGTYYTYIIQGMMECGGKKVPGKEILTEVGFRSPQGNIYGSVSYENGQAVEGVEIRLEQDGNNIVSGNSILLSGDAPSGLSVPNMSEAFSNEAFTFQTWIKPTDASPKNQVLFSAASQYEIGFDNNTELYLKHGSGLVKTPYKFSNSEFVHISVVRSVDSIFVYAGDSILSKVKQAPIYTSAQKAFFLGSNGTGNAYAGHMDEVRIWNRALTHKDIEQDHKRLITGNEKNLIAYYRFDEIIDNAFFDISYKDNIYNENHGVINKLYAKHDTVIPDNEQLSLKGITNESGNYFINGVPYTGNGTQYKIIPRMGTHQFDPTHHTRFIGGNSLSHEANFKDKSSFPVSGYVYYSNSNVPVQGVMFKIDGTFANDGKGNVITTDDAGAFKISVPVGYHEVKAEKANHKFDSDGRITDSEGKDLNYQRPLSERKLYDKTTVRFIGRVAGGAIQEAYPLGHSLSTNNLGDSAKIEIQLEKFGSFDHKDIRNYHFEPKDAANRPNSSRWKDKKTTGSIKANKITIKADPKTGEFVVDLIPEKFKVNTVSTIGHTEVLKNPITIDLSEKLMEQEEVYAYKDSIESRGDVKYFNYSDTVLFNDSYKFILRQTPTIEIKQLVGTQSRPK